MTDLLFDTPWWFPAALAGFGIFLFWNGNRRQEPKVRNGGVVVLFAAVVVLALSYFIDTDVEKAVKRSKALVNAVEKRDWTAMRADLDPNVSLAVLGFNVLYENRDEILRAAKDGVEQQGLKNVHILSTSAERSESLISVTMSLVSEQDSTMGRPIPTSWKMEWQRSGKEWTLVRITCIKIGNLTGENVARQFPAMRP